MARRGQAKEGAEKARRRRPAPATFVISEANRVTEHLADGPDHPEHDDDTDQRVTAPSKKIRGRN
jgi:hypothetical protein